MEVSNVLVLRDDHRGVHSVGMRQCTTRSTYLRRVNQLLRHSSHGIMALVELGTGRDDIYSLFRYRSVKFKNLTETQYVQMASLYKNVRALPEVQAVYIKQTTIQNTQGYITVGI
jgi:hypothetical protein